MTPPEKRGEVIPNMYCFRDRFLYVIFFSARKIRVRLGRFR